MTVCVEVVFDVGRRIREYAFAAVLDVLKNLFRTLKTISALAHSDSMVGRWTIVVSYINPDNHAVPVFDGIDVPFPEFS